MDRPGLETASFFSAGGLSESFKAETDHRISGTKTRRILFKGR
jgi:hypothetical protein